MAVLTNVCVYIYTFSPICLYIHAWKDIHLFIHTYSTYTHTYTFRDIHRHMQTKRPSQLVWLKHISDFKANYHMTLHVDI